MSRLIRALLLGASLVFLFSPASRAAAAHDTSRDETGPVADAAQVVNVVVGDLSFVLAYGRAPRSDDSEALRLRTHLGFVEGLLRSRDVSHLPAATRAARLGALDALGEYWRAERFPHNHEHAGRRPCFIDAHGNICAVGYLVERSVGRAAAESINRSYQYASIAQIDTPQLDAWLMQHGFTRMEAAMIQPFYGPDLEVVVDPAGQVYGCPQGDGPTMGSSDSIVEIRLSSDGEPFANFPFEDMWLADNGAEVVGMWLCGGGTVADGNTDLDGRTSFSSSLAAGGSAEQGMMVYMAGIATEQLLLKFNSPDITGDGIVSLPDVGAFASDYAGGYAFRSDLVSTFNTLDLADVGSFAAHIGHVGCD